MFGKSNKSTNWRYSKDQLKMHQVIYSVGCGVHFSKPNNIGKSLEEKVNSLCAGQVMLFESCSGKNVKSLRVFFRCWTSSPKIILFESSYAKLWIVGMAVLLCLGPFSISDRWERCLSSYISVDSLEWRKFQGRTEFASVIFSHILHFRCPFWYTWNLTNEMRSKLQNPTEKTKNWDLLNRARAGKRVLRSSVAPTVDKQSIFAIYKNWR